MSDINKSKEIIIKSIDYIPKVGIILGSGLSDIRSIIKNKKIINYNNLPGFPKTSVEGHKGELIIGEINNTHVVCLNGRSHLYEGNNEGMITPIRTLKEIGIDKLVLTNAAGSINEKFSPGSLMLINDHINFQFTNPLVGINNDNYGPRFPDLTNAYDTFLKEKIKLIAKELSINLHEGTYLSCLGPNFETPAEIKAFKILGADAVGMSTVPEVILARHCGIKVIALSIITNLAAGISSKPITHEETLANAKIASKNISLLINEFVKRIAK
ncbi:MAG: Purine nucleoside phosphorylase 2 [Alphaproteobacteria bacterium MarineAlpha2_Bin1]|nr:MAG: Purine nucleoside phosphorylase 2 [Alphaproteobacteria bacterium MarineAlpha2_Bin1]